MGFCGLAHETRYNWVLVEWDIRNKIVLDFGCGSGYGSYMLAKKAGLVIGVDNSPKSIAFANEEYNADNIKYFTLDASSLEAIAWSAFASSATILTFLNTS
ncbi:MAG: class I SAM-dependent methyltransferase [bacterium]